jgi:transposase
LSAQPSALEARPISRSRRGKGCRRCRELEKKNRALEEQIRRLKAHNRRLERQLERTVRAGKRQAAPFSKGKPKRHPNRPGRRRGAEYGTPSRRKVPEHVDETIDVLPPDACPGCGGAVEAGSVSEQYQTEIPPLRPHVRCFRIHLGRCTGCGQAVRGRDPRQTSDAVGAAASQLGPRAVALGAHLNKGLGLSFDKCSDLYRTAFGIEVSRSGLCQALHRLAAAAEPTYDALIESLRAAPVVSPDETGWKVGGELVWLWAFATPEISVYAIQDGRGFAQAAGVLGTDFGGVLIRDGWAPYRRFVEAQHQSCLAHLLRRCREIIDGALAGAARFPHAVRRILQKGLDLRDRYLNEEISPHGLAVATGRLEAEMDRLLQWNVHYPPNLRFLKHLTREQPHLFTFLHDLDVEATNWWSEQAIRPAVVTRKICGGNRTWLGALTQEVLASVHATSRKQGLSPLDVFAVIYASPAPVVIPFKALSPPELQPP